MMNFFDFNIKNDNMYRFYSFTNYYLSSLQKGLQTAHVVSEMSVSNFKTEKSLVVYENWANNDKTIIILNGGNSASLEEIYEICKVFGEKLSLPYVKFHEDKQSLNGALTSVGIVLPKNVYEYAEMVRRNRNNDYSGVLSVEEEEFITMLNGCGLAN